MLAAISHGFSITGACRKAKIDRGTFYARRDSDPEFAEAVKDAFDQQKESLEDEGFRRAHKGVMKPVFHRGVKCGEVREYSDTLLIFLLKARDPKYRENGRTVLAGDPDAPLSKESTIIILPEKEIDNADEAATGTAAAIPPVPG